MKFTEKEIEAMRKAALLEKHNSIHSDYVYIGKERLEFAEQDIFYPYVRIMLPKTFLDLPESFAKAMYPSQFRPAVIKTNPSLTVNFAFSYFDAKMNMDEVIDCTHYYLSTMRRMYPGNRYLENSEHFMDAEETRILGWYSFSNPTVDGYRYNIHAFTAIESMRLRQSREGFCFAFLIPQRSSLNIGSRMRWRYLILQARGEKRGDMF